MTEMKVENQEEFLKRYQRDWDAYGNKVQDYFKRKEIYASVDPEAELAKKGRVLEKINI